MEKPRRRDRGLKNPANSGNAILNSAGIKYRVPRIPRTVLYTPQFSREEVAENHRRFAERAAAYKKKGVDTVESRGLILEKAYPLKGSILEIGTGTGHTALALAKAGYKFISVDIDRETLKIAALNLKHEKVLSNVTFYVMDATGLLFANANFDNVVCISLFHHIESVRGMLSEIDRVLCAGGRAVLADFNKNGMNIVNTVHKEEGRVHEDSGVTKDHVLSYFRKLDYEIDDFESKCHWVLFIKKRAGR